MDPTLSPFGKYYDAATKKFCVGIGEGGEGGGGSGNSGVRQDFVDEEDECVVSLKIPNVSWPKGVFPPGSEAGNRRDAKKPLDGEKEGDIAVSPSIAPSDSWLASPDAGQEEEARVYWDGVLAHVNEAGDDALREKKQGMDSLIPPPCMLPV